MIKKHESSNVIMRVTNEALYAFFTDAMTVESRLVFVHRVLSSFLNGESDEEDVFDCLDELRLPTNNITTVASCHPSTVLEYSKYLKRTSDVLSLFSQNVAMIVEKGIYPSEGDVQILEKEIVSIIGGLTYFLVSDFGIADTLQQIKNGEDYDIDEIYDSYLKANGLSAEEVGEGLTEDYAKYRLHFDFFDEYPELEGAFETAAGPGYNLIPEGVLNLDIVNKIISGDLTVEDVLEQVAAEEEEE